MPFIGFGELFGNYVFVVDKGIGVALFIGYFALLMSIPFMANLPQPAPRWQ